MKTTNAKRGAPLPEPEQQEVRNLIAEIGATAASAALEVARETLARAAAGMNVHRAIATHLRVGLAARAAMGAAS